MYKDAFEAEPNQSEEVVKECRVKRIIKEIMDERGIYEIRKSQIQNFYIESFSDEWLLVVKNLTRKETPSTNSIAIPHAALMRLWEIVSDKITLHEKSRKLQFQGEDAEDLFEKNAIHIESKRYRRTST